MVLTPIANSTSVDMYKTTVDISSCPTYFQMASIAKNILNGLNIYELYGHEWDQVSGPFCRMFDNLCDNASLVNVPYNDYNDEVVARIQNKRKQSSSSLK